MEKIKEAIEKAKGQQSIRPKLQQKVDNNKLFNKLVKDEEDELASIIYNETTSLKLNQVHLEDNRIIAINKNNPLSGVFDSLRTQVLQKMEENNWHTIAIVSPTPESGKTVVAINLAISISQLPQKTSMLIDFDLRKPRVASYLGIKTKNSINELLSGDAELPDVMVNPGIPRFTVLPTNKPELKSSEILSSKKIERMITEVKERYESRVVIIDLPPLLSTDDAMVLLPLIDCALLVVGDGMSTESELEDAMRLLSKCNLLGVVLNRAEAEPQSYYYG